MASGPTRLSVRVGVGLPPVASGADPTASLWSLVETLEEVGYDSIWLSDSAARGAFAPLPTLAAIAARTERLKLGTNVLVLPPRNPLTPAREMATVDSLSSGRLLPAGGLGVDLPRELEALGVRREERTARLEESMAIVKALWGGGPVTFEGRFWQLHDVTPQAGALLDRRPDLQREEHVALGAAGTRDLLERFLAVGATKFVLIPLAGEPEAWLRELFPRVIEPLEAAGVMRGPAR